MKGFKSQKIVQRLTGNFSQKLRNGLKQVN